jgi:hypothetical protein
MNHTFQIAAGAEVHFRILKELLVVSRQSNGVQASDREIHPFVIKGLLFPLA